ncbi:nickel pincer cofactor biosynthesis protein LarC [Halomarina ordinaria]|uniref:Putative nickel insertion protein n=1 Tax=Halomarina ordinaria TaxID=3033939 RepID=A0ABD5U7K3_9EURY|nr:nickel pincer cofactor biosynthesis protein LarC [Halomarina sp. PSRA2]
MTTIAFDGRMGASGDMLLGALVAAGADPAVLARVEERLPVEYEVDTVEKNGISATRVVVRHTGGEDEASDDDADHDADDAEHDHHHHGDDAEHDHHHHGDDHHGHSHHDHHEHDHAEGAGPLRTYREVVELVEGMGLPSDVEADATAVFRVLGEAEAQVHGTDLEATHFHEVGADDAIADVVGTCLLLADLDPDRVVTTPVATGGGEVSMSHGTYPVPAPAVLNIAAEADWEVRGGPVEAELLTPTGAALLAHLAEGVDAFPTLSVERVGYGAGGHDFPDHPNVLRATVGATSGGLTREGVRVLETNVDDVPPEVLGDLHESLAAVGARDVSVLPATMKKSRPGHLVKVIVRPEDTERVARRLAEETGTLGVRETGVRHRFVADREFETVELDLADGTHEVAVKVARDDEGRVFDVSAEYDDAARVARETDLPVREVMRWAEAALGDR